MIYAVLEHFETHKPRHAQALHAIVSLIRLCEDTPEFSSLRFLSEPLYATIQFLTVLCTFYCIRMNSVSWISAQSLCTSHFWPFWVDSAPYHIRNAASCRCWCARAKRVLHRIYLTNPGGALYLPSLSIEVVRLRPPVLYHYIWYNGFKNNFIPSASRISNARLMTPYARWRHLPPFEFFNTILAHAGVRNYHRKRNGTPYISHERFVAVWNNCYAYIWLDSTLHKLRFDFRKRHTAAIKSKYYRRTLDCTSYRLLVYYDWPICRLLRKSITLCHITT